MLFIILYNLVLFFFFWINVEYAFCSTVSSKSSRTHCRLQSTELPLNGDIRDNQSFQGCRWTVGSWVVESEMGNLCRCKAQITTESARRRMKAGAPFHSCWWLTEEGARSIKCSYLLESIKRVGVRGTHWRKWFSSVTWPLGACLYKALTSSQGSFGFSFRPLTIEQIVIFISGLFKDLRSENRRHHSRWCRIWQDHTQLVPGFSQSGAAGMWCLLPRVLWFEVCIFPLALGHALWVQNGWAAAMTVSWPVVNLSPAPQCIFTCFSSTWIHQIFASIKIRRERQPVGSYPLANRDKDCQLSFACNLHQIPHDCLQCQEAKLTSVPF